MLVQEARPDVLQLSVCRRFRWFRSFTVAVFCHFVGFVDLGECGGIVDSIVFFAVSIDFVVFRRVFFSIWCYFFVSVVSVFRRFCVDFR